MGIPALLKPVFWFKDRNRSQRGLLTALC